jgi:predicted transcriptional regulator of viral defense system
MAKNAQTGHRSLTVFVDDLQASGRYTFTRKEAAKLEPRSDVALKAALRRLKQRGRIVSPRRGFYVVVPTEYRAAGCPPASWFIDDLMRYLRQPYYVGLLSAAAIHGAAHQQPMIFQVVTDRPTRPIRVARVQIEFHMSRSIKATPVIDVQTDTGSMRVSTPEVTAFDLVRFAAAAGYLNNVATVLEELTEKADAGRLAKIAKNFPTADAQRLGRLLEHIGAHALAAPLGAWLKQRRHRSVLLAPWQKNAGRKACDSKWRVIPNEDLEADV